LSHPLSGEYDQLFVYTFAAPPPVFDLGKFQLEAVVDGCDDHWRKQDVLGFHCLRGYLSEAVEGAVFEVVCPALIMKEAKCWRLFFSEVEYFYSPGRSNSPMLLF